MMYAVISIDPYSLSETVATLRHTRGLDPTSELQAISLFIGNGNPFNLVNGNKWRGHLFCGVFSPDPRSSNPADQGPLPNEEEYIPRPPRLEKDSSLRGRLAFFANGRSAS